MPPLKIKNAGTLFNEYFPFPEEDQTKKKFTITPAQLQKPSTVTSQEFWKNSPIPASPSPALFSTVSSSTSQKSPIFSTSYSVAPASSQLLPKNFPTSPIPLPQEVPLPLLKKMPSSATDPSKSPQNSPFLTSPLTSNFLKKKDFKYEVSREAVLKGAFNAAFIEESTKVPVELRPFLESFRKSTLNMFEEEMEMIELKSANLQQFKLKSPDLDCIYCPFKAKYKKRLTVHVNKFHGRLTNLHLPCPFSGCKTWLKSEDLKNHQQAIHPKINSTPQLKAVGKFECIYCKKRYKYKRTLRVSENSYFYFL